MVSSKLAPTGAIVRKLPTVLGHEVLNLFGKFSLSRNFKFCIFTGTSKVDSSNPTKKC